MDQIFQGSDYEIAKITQEEENKISELERALSEEHNQELVLIAYQKVDKDNNHRNPEFII